MPHPYLWPAIIGAILGLVLIVWVSIWLARRWKTQKHRWWIFAAIAVFEVAFWLNIYAWFIEPNMLVVRRVEIVSEHWQGAPLTIAAIGDTHIAGPHVDAARMGRIVARVNELRPELVVLLGDYVAGHATEAERSPAENQEIIGGVSTFAALNARYGVVAVIGNHDSWYNREAITVALQNAGIAVLWNRSIVIRTSSGPIVIAGLADEWTGEPNFWEALDGAPEDVNTIALAHNPDTFDDDQPDNIALMLASHSHCGQVSVPLLGRPILPLRNKAYGCHLIEKDGRIMYVTGGIGTSGIPVRFLNPPEIALITLRGNIQPPDRPSQQR